MKKPVPFLWRYVPWHVLLLIVSLSTLGIFSSLTLRRTYMDRITSELTARSRLAGAIIGDALGKKDYDRIESVCDSLGSIMPGRFTVILPDGLVVGDSDESPAQMENHAGRPEIIHAITDGVGRSIRFSNTVKLNMLYVAVPYAPDGTVVAVVRSSLPLTQLTDTLHALYRRITLVLICVIIGAAVIALIISHSIRRPIKQLIEGSQHLSRGELDYRMHISDPHELMMLGRAMNSMAADLEKLISTMQEQQQEMKSVLTGMSEALIAINQQGQISRFNDAAGALFSISPEDATGKNLEEVIRNMDLLRFVKSIRENRGADQHEAIIKIPEDRFLQARGSILPCLLNKSEQILLVLNDITRMKRLENVRKEFVANVSHELKTPITAIAAAVDTLQSGAVNDAKNSKRFLTIIAKQTERLHNIVEDLLQISRFESTAHEQEIEQSLTVQPVLPIIKEAVSICRSAAAKKQITIEIRCTSDTTAVLHPPSLEQALVNLIDNAVKYSPNNSNILIVCESDAGHTTITVTDFGEGISAEHQERIFERFYRVDKSRSREQGGTGLGLAIVKHAVLMQKGSIRVKSALSKGSSFTITLPGKRV
ncbi:HAMP domain-containing protein [bacterium]|nr:HAMP domain-containing protein [bacterium]